jgi:hypothetical protein
MAIAIRGVASAGRRVPLQGEQLLEDNAWAIYSYCHRARN